MNFNFVDPNIISFTEYKYPEFDDIVKRFGYTIEKNGFLHKYFNWEETTHWSFKYDKYDAKELQNIFSKSTVTQENIGFYLRLTSDMPIILINSMRLGEALEDLCYETGMGWEGISIDGRFIIEFTDSFENLAISNFRISE